MVLEGKWRDPCDELRSIAPWLLTFQYHLLELVLHPLHNKAGKSLLGFIGPLISSQSVANCGFVAYSAYCCCCQVASVVSDSVQPHRRQPTRLLHPWDFPGKSAGVGCHCLLLFSLLAFLYSRMFCLKNSLSSYANFFSVTSLFADQLSVYYKNHWKLGASILLHLSL